LFLSRSSRGSQPFALATLIIAADPIANRQSDLVEQLPQFRKAPLAQGLVIRMEGGGEPQPKKAIEE
jgi:hypothetical protein